MITRPKNSTLAVMLGLAVLTGVGIYAGSLEPPGAPAPTKTAEDETDPRIPIRGSDLPLTIDTPGSYYLAEDSAGAGGIFITASNVTIDLMGYCLCVGTGDGISSIAAADWGSPGFVDRFSSSVTHRVLEIDRTQVT